MASPLANVASSSVAPLSANGSVIATSPDAVALNIEGGALALWNLFLQSQALLTGEASAEGRDGAGDSGAGSEEAPVRGDAPSKAQNSESPRALAAALQIHVAPSAPTKISLESVSPESLVEAFPALARAAAWLAAPWQPAAPPSPPSPDLSEIGQGSPISLGSPTPAATATVGAQHSPSEAGEEAIDAASRFISESGAAALGGPVLPPAGPSQWQPGEKAAGAVPRAAIAGPQPMASEPAAPVRGEIAFQAQLSQSSRVESDGKPTSPEVAPPELGPRSERSPVHSHQSESGQPPMATIRPLVANSGSPAPSDTVPPAPAVSSPQPAGLASRPPAPSDPAPRPFSPAVTVADADLQPRGSQGPVRQINIPLRTEGITSAQVILTERGGQVGVTVRSGDPAAVEALRGQVQQLTTGLESNGYQVRYWTPPTATASQGEAQSGADSSNSELRRQLEDHQPQPDPDSRRPSRAGWDELFEENLL